MLVCSVSQLRRRVAIAADIAELATALDDAGTGNVVFATLVDDPASVGEFVDAYLGEIMLEAANATDTLTGTVPVIVAADVVEAATAAEAQSVVAGFTPASLAGLVGWWDAGVTASLNLTGSNINSVADQSGGGQTLIASGTAPTYNATGLNSRPTMIFASGQALEKTSFPMGTGKTLTIWYVGTLGTSGGRTLSYTGVAPNDYDNYGSWLLNSNSTTQVQLYRAGFGFNVSASAHPAIHRFIATIDAAGNSLIYVDGVSTTLAVPSGNWVTNGTFDVGRSASTAPTWAGPVGECGIATGYSDATTVANLDSYLKTKWGL